jgi:hypothetical protein
MSDAVSPIDASELPEDPAALKALLITERRQRAELAAEVARLSAIVAAYRRAMFGRRSEKLDPGQLELALEDTEQTFGEERAEADGDCPEFRVRAGDEHC